MALTRPQRARSPTRFPARSLERNQLLNKTLVVVQMSIILHCIETISERKYSVNSDDSVPFADKSWTPSLTGSFWDLAIAGPASVKSRARAVGDQLERIGRGGLLAGGGLMPFLLSLALLVWPVVWETEAELLCGSVPMLARANSVMRTEFARLGPLSSQ